MPVARAKADCLEDACIVTGHSPSLLRRVIAVALPSTLRGGSPRVFARRGGGRAMWHDGANYSDPHPRPLPARGRGAVRGRVHCATFTWPPVMVASRNGFSVMP